MLPKHALFSTPAQRQSLLQVALLAGVATAVVLALPEGLSWPVRALFAVALALVVSAAGVLLLGRVLDAQLAVVRERERRFTGLLSIAADAYLELDKEGVLQRLACRDAGGRFHDLGLSSALPIWALPDLVMAAEAQSALQMAVQQQQPARGIKLAWSWPGEPQRRHLELAIEPRWTDTGVCLGHWGVLQDSSSEVHAKAALEATELRYKDLFRWIPSAVVLHKDGQVLDANPAALRLFGADDLATLQSRRLIDLYAPEEMSRLQARRDAVGKLDNGQGLPEAAYRLRPAPDRELHVRVTSARLDTADGPAVLSIYTDETFRQQAELAIQRSSALLTQLVQIAPDMITLTDLQNNCCSMVNPTFCRLTGYTEQEVIGRNAADLKLWVRPEDRQVLIDRVRRNKTVQGMVSAFRAKDGRHITLLMSAAMFQMEGRDYLVIYARDISASEETRLLHEAILQSAPIGIFVTRQRRIVLTNPKLDAMMGWPVGTLLGQEARVMAPTEADYEALSQEAAPLLRAGQRVDVERWFMRRDGSQFLCRLFGLALNTDQPSSGATLWLAEDVTEARQVEQALAKAKDDAEAASRAKSAFLANTSHEIRTPLNALLGLARLARSPEVDPERRSQYIEQISDSAGTLSAILSDILDLSKIEAGKMHIEHLVFDLRELIHSLELAYGALADTKGLAFYTDRDADTPWVVQGDSVRLRQILSNFLNNALKFTVHGHIRLRVCPAESPLLRFEVEDTGPGIEDAVQARLFNPFTQADNSTTRRVGGTGLGLSICRELARAMGGKIGVRSQIGQGSCFWVELPLPPGTPEELESGTSGYGVDPMRGARALMVEDNPVNMMISVAMLEEWGMEVTQAGDGLEAIEAVERAADEARPFDVVLMDVQMPGMGGHEATALLRRRFGKEELPIVALTAAALVSERDQALAAGMNEFLTKPIDAQRLRHTLARLLRHRGGGLPPRQDRVVIS